MSISNRDIQTTIKPLRFIFWGVLICVIDFTFSHTVNGEGWKFDIINDLVGMMMITWGVFQLGKIDVHDRYQTAMLLVRIIAVLSCFDSFHGHAIYDVPPLISFLLSVLGFAAIIATVVFCVAMRWLSDEAGLQRSAKSWSVTTLLFVFIYLIPLGSFYCASAIAIVTETSFNINLGPAGLLLMPVFCIPLVHLFVSTSRMKVDAESNLRIGQQEAALDGNSAALHSHQRALTLYFKRIMDPYQTPEAHVAISATKAQTSKSVVLGIVFGVVVFNLLTAYVLSSTIAFIVDLLSNYNISLSLDSILL